MSGQAGEQLPDVDFDDERHVDIAAEQSLLGACMESAVVVEQVAGTLASPNDFFRPLHQTIFRVLLELTFAGDPTDPVTVLNAMTEQGLLGQFGVRGPSYLLDLMQWSMTSSIPKHASIVAGYAKERRLRQAAQRFLQKSSSASYSTDEALAEFEAEVAAVRERSDAPGQSWKAVDLGPILRGDHEPAVPAVGVARSDGLQLLYPGKEHGVIGEMECGKSWFSTACCAAELAEGNHVVYIHFEEADPTDTVGRLLALGASASMIQHLFRFVGPDEPVRPALLAALLDPAPTLVILDGVNEAMALHGQGIRDEDGAAAFRRLLVKPCTAVGAAVLSADHVVKDKEKQGRNALGSVHKGNGLTGSLIMLENADPFGRGQRGRSHLFVTKDRPGHLRRNGRPTKTSGKTFMGELVVDDTRTLRDGLDLRIWAPAEQDENTEATDPNAEIDEQVLQAVRDVIAVNGAPTGRTIRAKSPFGTDKTLGALERLVLDGQLIRKPAPKGAWHYLPVSGPDLSEQTNPS